MNKLSLNLDDLSVDSFQTGTAADAGGTVHGQGPDPGDPVEPGETLELGCFPTGLNMCHHDSEAYTVCCATWEMGSNCEDSNYEICITETRAGEV